MQDMDAGVGKSNRPSLLINLLQSYQKVLHTAPLSTKLVTSFSIYAISETIAQLLTSGEPDKDEGGARRPSRFSKIRWREVFGYSCLAFYNAPAMHTFFQQTADLSVTSRVVTNMLVADPINTLVSLMFSALMKGGTVAEAFQTACSRFIPAMKMVLTVSLPVHLANHWFMPLQYRVLFNNSAALVVTTYLCLLSVAKKKA